LTKVEKLLKDWKIDIPPEVAKNHVWLVVKEFFPESELGTKRGSHEIKIKSSVIKDFVKKNLSKSSWEEIRVIVQPFNHLGEMIIPCRRGRTIRAVYVKKLLKAIEIQELIKNFLKGEGSGDE